MFKFFRQIRQRLLSENKFNRYLLYALGEIVLVVIGILIALQINNWNENRKTERKIKNSLLALKGDLAQDTVLISARLPFINEQYILNESLRARVANPEASVDTLVKIMRFEFNILNQTGLIEKLSDSLKTSIKDFYNRKT